MNDVVRGVIAGAAGTVALNVATYFDMALRGRPASTVPADLAGRLAEVVGVDALAGRDGADEQAGNRRTGTGALLGYVNGLGIGAAYGALSAGSNDRGAIGPRCQWPAWGSVSQRWRPRTSRRPRPA